ncbi:hypothetical protein GCM10010321_15010 [Streptomyces chartreusis]|nr:hypothetical protein GCM10010321_15010 [Streptomyces chartreusis]
MQQEDLTGDCARLPQRQQTSADRRATGRRAGFGWSGRRTAFRSPVRPTAFRWPGRPTGFLWPVLRWHVVAPAARWGVSPKFAHFLSISDRADGRGSGRAEVGGDAPEKQKPPHENHAGVLESIESVRGGT